MSAAELSAGLRALADLVDAHPDAAHGEPYLLFFPRSATEAVELLKGLSVDDLDGIHSAHEVVDRVLSGGVRASVAIPSAILDEIVRGPVRPVRAA